MRLISFLGTGNYGETAYTFDGKTCRTRYVAQALASFIQPSEIRLIATTEAWNQHGDALAQRLSVSGHPTPERVSIPTGGESHQLWEMFTAIVNVVRTSNDEVLLDITHGFRMQPFFAAACIQYVQAVVPNPPKIRVVYGEYRSGEDVESPIWELTPFLDVLSWSRDLMLFLRTGQAGAVVEPTNRLARDLSKQWANAGKQGQQPQLQKLSKALQQFGDDLTTIRTGSLLLGNQSSASQLDAVIRQTKDEVTQHLPALAFVLDQVAAIVAPLGGEGRLSSPGGQRRMLALARLYYGMGRYSEAISILREGWITLGATNETDEPGSKDFNLEARKQREDNWANNTKQASSVAGIRNDIQHAGFQKQPLKKDAFNRQLTSLLQSWETAIAAMEADR